MIKVDISGAESFFGTNTPNLEAAQLAHKLLTSGSGAGAEFTGWLELPRRMQQGELSRVLDAAEKIRSDSEVLVVVGIGGSYLGARAAIELLGRAPGSPEIVFAGCGLSPDYLNELLSRLDGRDFSVNVISKSGTTLEPALSFRVLRRLAEQRYGEHACERIYATTDANRGALKEMADGLGYTCFTVPDDVGGRYSVLSAVGLLPMAVAGIDVAAVLDSAAEELNALIYSPADNAACLYAAARQLLYRLGKRTEILACYEPSFRFMAEWWKQLYGESEGKNGLGIFPASVEFSADLHSMGQYIQSGPRDIMETVVAFESCRSSLKVPFSEGDPDKLNYLSGTDMGDIARIAAQAVKTAHIEGGVPNISISVTARNERGFGELVVFFEFACAISAYMQEVNPFDQPGVEAYKKKMFALLEQFKTDL